MKKFFAIMVAMTILGGTSHAEVKKETSQDKNDMKMIIILFSADKSESNQMKILF